MASTVGTEGRAASRDYSSADDQGVGWVFFAGTMIAIVGILNFIYGIAAVGDSTFFVADAKFVITNLNTWGWLLLLLGLVQMGASIGIFMQTTGARWVGIISAAGNSIIQLL